MSKEKAPEREEMSEEEIKKQKAELMKFYKDQTPLLKQQAEYEETITRIEIAKFSRLEIMLTKAQMMAPPPGQEEQEEQQEPQARKLKPQS